MMTRTAPTRNLSRRITISLVAATLAGLGLHAAPARACTDGGAIDPGYMCPPSSFVLPEKAVIPPGQIGLPFDTFSGSGFELTTASGEVVPSEVRDLDHSENKVIVPLAPLAPDTDYQLRYVDTCTDRYTAPSPTPVAQSRAFRTSAEKPLPTEVGLITVETKVVDVPYMDSCGGPTGGSYQVATAIFKLKPSARLVPYLPVVQIDGVVDDTIISFGVRYGAVDTSGAEMVVGQASAICSGNDILKQGSYTATVKARIAGTSTVITTGGIGFKLDCNGAAPASGSGNDNGTGSTAGNGTGSTAGNGTDGNGTAADRSGGCTVSSSTSAAPHLAWLLLLAGLPVMARRLRRRPGR